MTREKTVLIKLGQDDVTVIVTAISDFIRHHDKSLAGVCEWSEGREPIAKLARKIDLAALDAGMQSAFNSPAPQVIYE